CALPICAFVTPTPELAAEQARAAEQTLAASDESDLPALLGVPLPIKDLTMVAGVPMQAGSAALQGFVPEVDEGIVTRFRQAGSLMVGKTRSEERRVGEVRQR